jgi:demethylspheroidene O-methyltransferase
MAGPGWREVALGWRNRLLADPRFQRWAADFPLTRVVAQRRTEGLFDLVAGFVYSQTLYACVRLNLFEALAAGPKTMAALVETLDLPTDAAERLLSAAVALRLVDRAGDARYALGPHGAALLGAAGLAQMIDHHGHLYADLAEPVDLLRRGRGSLAAYWPYATASAPDTESAEGVAAYSRLMASTQPAVAADVIRAYPLGRHRRLMDVGGGEGAFLAAAGAAAPKLDLMLFDLPAVTERAKVRLAAAGLLGRTDIHAGDFLADPLPGGADLITLVRILHDQDEAGALTLLRKVRAALPSDGALLIAEPMAGDTGRNRMSDVYFAFYLLAMGRGRARTPREVFGLLRTAGFTRMRRLRTRTPFLLRAIVAEP